MSNTRFLYHYDEAQERAYYREMLDAVEQLTGVRMKGMGGPGPQAGTESTPDLMAESGFHLFRRLVHGRPAVPASGAQRSADRHAGTRSR